MQGFEVVDDGSGIKEVDFDILAKRGTTSKISEFDDIYAVKTMGFRGEALSSLCNIANLTIQTKQASQSTGWVVKFNHMGDVLTKEQMAKKVSSFRLICLGRHFCDYKGSFQGPACQAHGVQEKLQNSICQSSLTAISLCHHSNRNKNNSEL